MRTNLFIIGSVLFTLLFNGFGSIQQAEAAVFLAGDAATLIQHIQTANTNPDADVIILTADINLATNATVFTDTSNSENAFPMITTDITILGNGYQITRVSGHPDLYRFFYITSTGSLTLVQLTLQGGNSSVLTGASQCGNLACGGAIFSYGTLRLYNSTLTNNLANDQGGAIFSAANAQIQIQNSTIKNNHAGYGGGAFLYVPASASIENSTIANNTADFNGGGLYLTHRPLTITNSTLSGNAATHNSALGIGSGGSATFINSTVSNNRVNSAAAQSSIVVTSGSAILNNTLVANSYFQATAGGASDCSSSGFSGTQNLSEDSPTNCPDADPVTPGTHYDTTLSNNGGRTATHALLDTAPHPAIAQANTGNCPSSDQRGVYRLADSACDIGAYEYVDVEYNLPEVGFEEADGSTQEDAGTAPVNLRLVVQDGPAIGGRITVYIHDMETGTATSGTDYTPVNVQTVTFDCTSGCAPGTYLQPLPVPITADNIDETTESIRFQIAGFNGNATSGEVLRHELFITNVIPPTPTLTPTATATPTSTPTVTLTGTPGATATANTPSGGLAPAVEVAAAPLTYITKRVDKTLAQPGESVIFTIEFMNPKGSPLRNVIISDTFDSRFGQLEVLSSPLGTTVVNGNTATVQGFELMPGQRATLLIRARISEQARPGDVLLNVATLESPDASIHTSETVRVTIIPATLPATGETPFWVYGLVGLLLAGMAFWIWRR